MKVKTVIAPTTKELFFPQNEIVVSKTDLKGRITYANRTFCALAGYGEAELLGQPHSIVRHPDMPRAVFKQLWDAIHGGREIFAYVKNMAKTGDYYWVFAHVTPSYDESRNIVAFIRTGVHPIAPSSKPRSSRSMPLSCGRRSSRGTAKTLSPRVSIA
jgi:PAS domain S-box-containing protein